MIDLPRTLLVRLYRDMLRIRKVQLRIESLYHLDEMKTPVHLCIGQEAVAVGVCANLEKDDCITSNHRGHGHYLAKGGDLKALVAELYCRETGCSKGRGGSMHLVDASIGHFGSSSIVAGGIPIATGLGLAINMKMEPRVSVVFFGDGAADEGVLYESINFAILRQLPVVYVYENNQYSVCSPVSARKYGKNLFHYAPRRYLHTKMVNGNAVLDIYGAAKLAVERARNGEGPSFIECKTYRMRGHAGAGSDAHLGYRSTEEIASWQARCPVDSFRSKLLKHRMVTQQELKEMETELEHEVEEAFRFARESPLPDGSDVCRYLYSE
jgi:acetoin:2,6-dichlorophenolindophenol oxidoreductase subunit alpha